MVASWNKGFTCPYKWAAIVGDGLIHGSVSKDEDIISPTGCGWVFLLVIWSSFGAKSTSPWFFLKKKEMGFGGYILRFVCFFLPFLWSKTVVTFIDTANITWNCLGQEFVTIWWASASVHWSPSCSCPEIYKISLQLSEMRVTTVLLLCKNSQFSWVTRWRPVASILSWNSRDLPSPNRKILIMTIKNSCVHYCLSASFCPVSDLITPLEIGIECSCVVVAYQ